MSENYCKTIIHSWFVFWSKMKKINSLLDISYVKYIAPFCGLILPGLGNNVFFPKLTMGFYKKIPYISLVIVGSYSRKTSGKLIKILNNFFLLNSSTELRISITTGPKSGKILVPSNDGIQLKLRSPANRSNSNLQKGS